jgi:hypothetical protein
MEVPLPELLSAGSAIVATSFGFSKIFFARLTKLEGLFTNTIEKLTGTIAELDKRLAVNSCIIDNFMEFNNHGHHRNDKIDKCIKKRCD